MVEESSAKGEVTLQRQMAGMDPTGPKTVFSNQDSAGNLVTIFAEQSKRSTENKTIRRTLPGKSHVSRIILHDNTSQERLLDMKLADIKNSQRKMDAFMTHQKKTFLKKMEKKHSSWAREHARQAVEFNSKGTRSVGFMLEMMRANPELYGGDSGGGGTPRDAVGASVTGEQIQEDEEEDDDDESSNLPSLDDTGYANAMSQARMPERKLKHRTTGIPSLPTLLSLPAYITQKEDPNPFLTCDETESDEEPHEDYLTQVERSNTVVSFSSNFKQILPGKEEVTLPPLGRKTSVISTRSQTAPKVGIVKKLPPVSNERLRPETEPRNLHTTHTTKKAKNNNHQPRLPGPEPTFISETLPQIDTNDPSLVKVQSQHKSKKSRRAKRRARAKEAYNRDSSRNPLKDERFVKLQTYLSPVPSDKESQVLLKMRGQKELCDEMDMDTVTEETDVEIEPCNGS